MSANVFRIMLAMGFVAWTAYAWTCLWPRWRAGDPRDALRAILCVHSFRYLGLSFLLPGIASPDLPRAFAVPAAYGDLIASILALATLAVLRTRFAAAVALFFNLEGLGDLAHNVYETIALGLPERPEVFGPAIGIVVFYVPLLVVTHALVFRLLLDGRLRRGATSAARAALPPRRDAVLG